MSIDHKPLKLLAKDLEDLQIFAAHLQDSLLPITSMKYSEKDKSFCMVANRFCWEHPAVEHVGEDLYHRVHSKIHFDHVKNVQQNGIDQHGDIRNLNLLTIEAKNPEDKKAGHAILHFSEGGAIKIDYDKLHCKLADMHEPWPTRNKPKHIHEHLEQL